MSHTLSSCCFITTTLKLSKTCRKLNPPSLRFIEIPPVEHTVRHGVETNIRASEDVNKMMRLDGKEVYMEGKSVAVKARGDFARVIWWTLKLRYQPPNPINEAMGWRELKFFYFTLTLFSTASLIHPRKIFLSFMIMPLFSQTLSRWRNSGFDIFFKKKKISSVIFWLFFVKKVNLSMDSQHVKNPLQLLRLDKVAKLEKHF